MYIHSRIMHIQQWMMHGCPIIIHRYPLSVAFVTDLYPQPNATVKTNICPIHYFRSIYATIKKYVPNDLVKLTVTSVVFGFHIIAIVFVCWPRQFWHFHPVATEQFNFNCCQNTKFVRSTILVVFFLQERMIHWMNQQFKLQHQITLIYRYFSIVFVWWLRQFWHFQPVGTGPLKF